MLKQKTIAFIGAGSMAEAMISGLVKANIIPPKQIIVTNRSNQERLKELERNYGIQGINRDELQFGNVDIFILAMKPKDIDTALKSIYNDVKPEQLIMSVLAGISTSYIEENLSKGQQVIRVMPNTSSMIGESATALSPGKQMTRNNVKLASNLLNCIGETYLINEKKMDIFTGLAGSGPAYFYYLMEHMEKEGQEAGLDIETTRQIIAQTIVGAAKMIQEQDETPTVLRENVTSPNGTTAAGLKALDNYGGGEAIAQAVKHASKKSLEISSQLQKNLSKQEKITLKAI